MLFGQEIKKTTQNDVVIENFIQLSSQQLYDTANYYYSINKLDPALVYYNLFINTPMKDNDIEQQKRLIVAFVNSGMIYYWLSDYNRAYVFFIKALILCEKIDNSSYKSTILNNLGIIYDRFKKYDIAKEYYTKAISFCDDSIKLVLYLNNLGDNSIKSEKFDSAFYHLNKSLKISKQHSNAYLALVLTSIAENYQKIQQFDSAFYYFGLALTEQKNHSRLEHEAELLSKLGSLFFEVNRIDSALFYIDLSNIIASDKKLVRILADNYLLLSKIEESNGRKIKAFDYFKIYSNLKDSVFSVDKFNEINQLQRLYEISKTNQQIEQLYIEQQIKEQTIRYQRIFQFFTSSILLIVSIIVVVFSFQKRKLNFKNNILVSKNLEILELLKKSAETKEEKEKKNLQNDNTYDDAKIDSSEIKGKKGEKNLLKDNAVDDLLIKISKVMEDIETVCNPNFSLIKLSELVQYNHRYVSDVINKTYKKNFRSYLNRFRIREAQRIFSELDSNTFKIQSIAQQVGFKSLNAFYEAFKEVTGVNPGQFLKNMRNQVL